MANLSLTLRCGRRCSYCFALRSGVGPEAMPDMTPDTYHLALELLRRSGVDQARLLGGEPTGHPRFVEYAQQALDAGLRVFVFSNGLMPEPTARYLAGRREAGVAVLINAGDPTDLSQEQEAHQAQTLSILGQSARLGRTLAGPTTSLDFLLDRIDAFDLARVVRVGVSQPIVGGANAFLAPRDYAAVGARLATFAAAAAERDVRVEFDCGVVPCMLPSRFIDSELCDQRNLGCACGPIPDILPDGTAIACYPLAQCARVPALRFEDLSATKRALGQALGTWREVGIGPECARCHWRREGRCLGGCVAAALLRTRTAAGPPFAVRSIYVSSAPRSPASGVGTGDASALPGPTPAPRYAIPYVDQPLEFWQALAEEHRDAIAEIYFPLPGGGVGSGRPPQPDAHLLDLLNGSPLPLSVLVNPIVLPRPEGEVAPEIMEAIRKLDGEHGLKGVTVTNVLLAQRLRRELPHLQVTVSVLTDITCGHQLLSLQGACDGLVPSGRIFRDREALRALRRAFPGRIRLIVNEGCLPGCLLRVQHFFEMASGCAHPVSLCAEALAEMPWLRLTGTWILPQHLGYYDGLFDELKLAGRVTLQDPDRYRRVLAAYVRRQPLGPHEIGGGPASLLKPIDIDEAFMDRVLRCRQRCEACSYCRIYFEQRSDKRPLVEPGSVDQA